MSIISAGHNDVGKINSLATTIWLAHYPAIVGEAQTLYMLDRMYSLDVLKKQIGEEECQFYIWEENHVPIAFAAIDIHSKPHGFLSKFYVLQEYRGKGVAQSFMKYLEDAFHKNGKHEIQLTVNRQNIGAINFYFKTGFKIARCEDFDIGNGYFMNDFVMKKMLDK